VSVCQCEGYQGESLVSVLLFIGVVSEVEREGLLLEGRENVMECDIFDWDGDV
jgi:hypothetical protein